MKAVLASLLLLPSAVLAAGTNDIPALISAYGELPPTFWEEHKVGAVIGAVILALLAAFVGGWLLRPKPAVVLPPEKIARDALAKLAREPEDGNVLSAVSQVLRRYVSQRFHLPDGELTTAEFTGNLARASQIDLQFGESLCGFLRECDVRKFSPAQATAPMRAVNRALEFIAKAEQQTAKPNLS